jgi:hypothetical protein
MPYEIINVMVLPLVSAGYTPQLKDLHPAWHSRIYTPALVGALSLTWELLRDHSNQNTLKCRENVCELLCIDIQELPDTMATSGSSVGPGQLCRTWSKKIAHGRHHNHCCVFHVNWSCGHVILIYCTIFFFRALVLYEPNMRFESFKFLSDGLHCCPVKAVVRSSDWAGPKTGEVNNLSMVASAGWTYHYFIYLQFAKMLCTYSIVKFKHFKFRKITYFYIL